MDFFKQQCVHTGDNAGQTISNVISQELFILFFLKPALSVAWELTQQARADQQAAEIHRTLPLQCQDYKHMPHIHLSIWVLGIKPVTLAKQALLQHSYLLSRSLPPNPNLKMIVREVFLSLQFQKGKSPSPSQQGSGAAGKHSSLKEP